MSGFHGAFATGVACQQGMLTLPDTWFRPTTVGLAYAPIVETRFLELAMSLLDFSPRIPLGTFSILLLSYTSNSRNNENEIDLESLIRENHQQPCSVVLCHVLISSNERLAIFTHTYMY